MADHRTYIRIILDKFFKENIVCQIIDKIVKFYYTIYSHPVKTLKFDGDLSLKKSGDIPKYRFGLVNSKTSTLG